MERRMAYFMLRVKSLLLIIPNRLALSQPQLTTMVTSLGDTMVFHLLPLRGMEIDKKIIKRVNENKPYSPVEIHSLHREKMSASKVLTDTINRLASAFDRCLSAFQQIASRAAIAAIQEL